MVILHPIGILLRASSFIRCPDNLDNLKLD